MHCKNCGHLAEENYCSRCGQSTHVSTINFTSLVQDLSTNVFQINKGLFFTILQVFKRPGHSIREYLQGKRKLYFKPIAYALVLSTVYFLASKFTGEQTWISAFLDGFTSYDGARVDENRKGIFRWFIKNFAYSMLLLIPVYGLASYLAFFGKKYSYLEHVVLNFYLTGHQMIFYASMTILGYLTGKHDICLWIAMLCSITFAFWTFLQFFEHENRSTIIVRTILSYILFLIFLLILLITIIGISETLGG